MLTWSAGAFTYPEQLGTVLDAIWQGVITSKNEMPLGAPIYHQVAKRQDLYRAGKRMNKILIGLPISDLQLLLAVSRRIDELSALDRLIQPEEFRLVRDLLVDIMEGYEHGLSTLYEAAREQTAPRV